MRRKKKLDIDYRVQQRWTPALAKHGFTPVASVFLSNYSKLTPPLTVVEAMLVIHLMSFKWSHRAPWPSLTTLAKLLGCSDRYVRKLCSSLEGVGYLKRSRNGRRTNEFDLSGLFAALEKFQATQTPERPRVGAPDASTSEDVIAELVRQKLIASGHVIAAPPHPQPTSASDQAAVVFRPSFASGRS